MRSATRTFGLLAALLVLGGGRCQAGMVDYAYSWSISPSIVLTGTNTETLNGLSTGSVALALPAAGTASSVLGSALATPIVGANISTSSSANLDHPDNYDTPFSITLHLTDTASGKSGDATFALTLQGTMTSNSSSVAPTFNSPLTQTLTLGSHLYSVSIDPAQIHIPAPTSTTTGSLDAQVKVSGLAQAPEPTTLFLAGLPFPSWGLPAAGAARRPPGAEPLDLV
jgi:hypothetical protein